MDFVRELPAGAQPDEGGGAAPEGARPDARKRELPPLVARG